MVNATDCLSFSSSLRLLRWRRRRAVPKQATRSALGQAGDCIDLILYSFAAKCLDEGILAKIGRTNLVIGLLSC